MPLVEVHILCRCSGGQLLSHLFTLCLAVSSRVLLNQSDQFTFPGFLGSVFPKDSPTLKITPRNQNNKTTANCTTYHRYLAEYFQQQETLSERRISELPWQLEKAGELEKLRQFLMEPE